MKDPVCGMNLAEGEGVSTEHEGQAVRFCSDGCKSKFEKNPDRYLQEVEE